MGAAAAAAVAPTLRTSSFGHSHHASFHVFPSPFFLELACRSSKPISQPLPVSSIQLVS